MNVTYFEIDPETIEVLAEHQKVPNEETAVETLGTREVRSGEQRQTVEYWNRLERRTRNDFVRGNPKEPKFEKRYRAPPKCNNGIWDRDLKLQL
jgi:hypothetical protein